MRCLRLLCTRNPSSGRYSYHLTTFATSPLLPTTPTSLYEMIGIFYVLTVFPFSKMGVEFEIVGSIPCSDVSFSVSNSLVFASQERWIHTVWAWQNRAVGSDPELLFNSFIVNNRRTQDRYIVSKKVRIREINVVERS